MEIQEFKTKVEAIGAILNMSVTFASEEDMRWTKWAHLTGGDGQDIMIEIGDHKTKERFSLTGCFPRDNQGNYLHYGSSRSITVAAEKSPEQIARDIEKRLIPEYLVELKKALDQVETSNRYHRARHENLKKIADHLGVNLSSWDSGKNDFVSPHLVGIGGKIEAQEEDKVTLTVEVTPEMAIRIIDLLREEKDAKNLI